MIIAFFGVYLFSFLGVSTDSQTNERDVMEFAEILLYNDTLASSTTATVSSLNGNNEVLMDLLDSLLLNDTFISDSTVPSKTNIENVYPLSMAILALIGSIIGIIGNLLILFAIGITKELRSRSHFFLFVLAIVDLINCIYYSYVRILIFNGNFFMSNHQCFLHSVIGLFTMNIQSGLTAAVGIDRYLSISYPMEYRMRKALPYLLSTFIPVLIYAIVITVWGYLESSNTVIVPVCFPPSAYNKSSKVAWLASNGIIVILVMFLYGAAQYNLKRFQRIRSKSTISLEQTAIRAQQSLSVIMFVYAATWAFTMFALLFMAVFSISKETQKTVEIFLAWPVIINGSCNLLIYWWRSMTFRDAFKRIFCCFRNNKLEPSDRERRMTYST